MVATIVAVNKRVAAKTATLDGDPSDVPRDFAAAQATADVIKSPPIAVADGPGIEISVPGISGGGGGMSPSATPCRATTIRNMASKRNSSSNTIRMETSPGTVPPIRLLSLYQTIPIFPVKCLRGQTVRAFFGTSADSSKRCGVMLREQNTVDADLSAYHTAVDFRCGDRRRTKVHHVIRARRQVDVARVDDLANADAVGEQ